MQLQHIPRSGALSSVQLHREWSAVEIDPMVSGEAERSPGAGDLESEGLDEAWVEWLQQSPSDSRDVSTSLPAATMPEMAQPQLTDPVRGPMRWESVQWSSADIDDMLQDEFDIGEMLPSEECLLQTSEPGP